MAGDVVSVMSPTLAPISVREVPDFRIALLTRSPLLDMTVNGSFERNSPDGSLTPEVAAARDGLTTAELWWVSRDMTELLEVAAAKVPDNPLRPEDAPCPRGLVFFERPLLDADTALDGETVDTDAMLWMPIIGQNGAHGLAITSLSRAGHRDHTMRGWGWIATSTEIWFLGESPSAGMDVDAVDRRRIAALWMLTAQTSVADTSRVTAQRSARKRCERADLPPDASDTRIVRLRRRASGAGDDALDSEVNYSHRWLVSGHWRNQWLPSVNAHRVQWISPHVKGPADKPLVIRDTVRAWVR